MSYSRFKIQDYKIEKPYIYPGTQLSNLKYVDCDVCWYMSSDKYCASVIANVEEVLQNKGKMLPSK